ncbi:MAG: ParA family protein [Myxococcales bacterium]|nr:MAG: ParA family protein [Myxococcales bacterium]
MAENAKATCSVCGASFTPEFAYQRALINGETRFYCSEVCAERYKIDRRRARGTRRIAVLNQKGGTGKTTTSVNLAAGLATRGFNVLLIDMDAQGNVGISLGIVGDRGVYHLLMEGLPVEECSVPIRANLDIITSNEMLAAAEVKLANRPTGRELALKEALIGRGGEKGYDYVILDCPPALSLVNQNALVYADEVLVPVSCDFLAMVGVKQVLRTIHNMNNFMGKPVSICGVLPTFYDVRTRLSQEVLDNLKEYFKDKTLTPIRVSTRLKEAPSHKQTIFEYAPTSNAASDYLALVDRLVN